MKKLFPEMTESLHAGYVFGIFFYWLIGFVIFPFLMPIIAYGLWEDHQVTAWIEVIYHVLNGLILLAFLKEHLSYTWFNVQMEGKNFLQTTAIACGLMIAWTVVSLGMSMELFGDPLLVLNIFPVSEMSVAQTPGYLVTNNPVFGTIALTIFSPIAITGLFYATGFAPACCKQSWLGYVVVSVVVLLPVLFDIFWRDGAEFLLISYFLSLPVHWLACWTYQRTESALAPMVSLAAFNLAACLVNIVIY